jgi:TolB-like protein/Flp pilus assembly protein TadD
MAAAVAVVAGALAVGPWFKSRPPRVRFPRTTIAVLPFRNLSADTSRAYLAGGLHEELLTQLAKVSALTVIGRTSVLPYAGSTKRLSQIGTELAVGSLVEGSVQIVGNRLRVNVQLIDPATEAHLWAEHYDRTLDDAFAVQSDIAQRIVSAVGATLTSAEAGAIAAAPTQNAEAYQLYLQGLDYFRRPGHLRQNLAIAQHLYERALALDSTFALAHLGLASVHWWYGAFEPYGAGPGLYHRELAAALRFAPQLPQARLAAILEPFWNIHDYRATLNELGPLVRSAPNDGELWGTLAELYVGLGYWDSVDVAFERASRLDPRDANLLLERGDVLKCRRRYSDAIAAYRRALLLAPDYVNLRIQLAWTYYMWKGELDSVRAVLRGLPDGAPEGGDPGAGADLAFVLLFDRRPDSVLSLLRARPGILTDPATYVPRTLLAAWAHRMRGDTAAARAAFDSTMVLLDSVDRAEPHTWQVHAWRGHALAGLGRHEEALREARWLEQFEASSRVYNYCNYAPVVRAEILVADGDTEVALSAIERLLVGPSGVTAPALRIDPRFDPIRSNPRFQALLVRYRDPIRY